MLCKMRDCTSRAKNASHTISREISVTPFVSSLLLLLENCTGHRAMLFILL